MRSVILTTVSLLVLLCFAANLSGQSRDAKPASPTASSITGQVLLDGQPAAGVTVAVSQRRIDGNQNMPLTKSVTDGDGRFQVTNLAAGVYQVAPLAPGFLVPNEGNFFQEGKSVTLDAGETVDEVNFSIKRGGVITGRVTNENNEPVIETRVSLMKIGEQGQAQYINVRHPFMHTTDDRGMYRFYGLPAGRYKVSVGESAYPHSSRITQGTANALYHRTFYPDVTDESKAEIVEVTDGGEATNVDVSVNSKMKTYTVSGRIVEASTGKPVMNIQYGYSVVIGQGEGQYLSATALDSNRTNAKGEFRVEGMLPGRYAVYMIKEEGMELYDEPAVFEVKDGNLSGLEVKARLGASISGVATLEGKYNPALASAFLQMRLWTQITPRALDGGFWNPPKISPDGTFRINGLRAGKARIYASGNQSDKKISLLRVEHNEVEVTDGIPIKAGEQITGVRLVFAYGTAVIRGQVKVENGELPEGGKWMVAVRRIGGNDPNSQRFAEVDGRGRFMMDEMIAGQYELTLQPGFTTPPGNRPLLPIKQTVSVTDGAVLQVVFVVDRGEQKEGQ
jgi:5-hydroxyisourate hydrolase-like protein (transthyretin family)